MKKKTELEKCRDYLVKDGIAHIKYHISDVHDIVHPLSLKGYELLSDDFIAFLEIHRRIIPSKTPVVLEISGKSLNKEEKELIDNTIWSSFCINMTSADMEAKACVKRVLFFFLYTILSVVLLFAVQDISEEIITNFAYLPFWFFGYRLLIYLVLDCMPLWKKRSWYRQIASMSVVFPDDDYKNLENISAEEIVNSISKYITETDERLRNNQLYLQYVREKGIINLGCTVRSLGDIILAPELKGREFMAPGLSGYLGQAEPFLRPDCRISFEINGKSFNKEEQGRIIWAIKNYYSFNIAAEEREIHDNKHKILLFSLLVFVSSVVVILWGTKADVAMHEFLIMLFWFFGDYLLEFILISRNNFKKHKKILENCRDMDVNFKPFEQ